ncbi:sensor histidine kinase [Desulfitobacterium metallireducens]|uniref:histidine kinase n=1 Tax=Desulfitobacterium metallireducens DSM 15288 TaxID=871968 RepID=W0E5H8_9FIRM|nr:ATP-binding protein [Desulfitobacterium metallireducens]AHF06120.1 membrane protein [Desulfitobacterium metallireducens DSM 15288]
MKIKNLKLKFKEFVVPNSLRFQLLSRTLAIMAILLAVIGVFQYVFMEKFIYFNNASSLQKQILAISPEAWEQISVGNLYADNLNHLSFNLLPDSTVAVIDMEGRFTVLTNSSSLNGGDAPQLDVNDYVGALQDKRTLNFRIVRTDEGKEQLVVLQGVENRDHWHGVVQVSVGTKSLTEMLMRQLLIFMLLALLALIVGLLAFIPVLRKILVPLSNMVDKVENIHAGNLEERLPVEQGQVEINRLAVSFNGMLERLETSFKAEQEAKEQMRRFVADASHELRTPLTSIHGFTEVLLRGAMNQPEKLYRSLKSMYTESERMKKLIEDLLLLAKLDRSPNLQRAELDLDELVLEMETQLRLLAGNRKVSFSLNSPAKGWLNEDKMKQIILNLFNNAVQHTDPESGKIKLSVNPVEGGIELTVKDNGQGISEEHLSHLFERFYRVDSSRTRKYGGAGLGLAITQFLVELHDGKIRVESTLGEGSTFYVWLPNNQLKIES